MAELKSAHAVQELVREMSRETRETDKPAVTPQSERTRRIVVLTNILETIKLDHNTVLPATDPISRGMVALLNVNAVPTSTADTYNRSEILMILQSITIPRNIGMVQEIDMDMNTDGDELPVFELRLIQRLARQRFVAPRHILVRPSEPARETLSIPRRICPSLAVMLTLFRTALHRPEDD